MKKYQCHKIVEAGVIVACASKYVGIAVAGGQVENLSIPPDFYGRSEPKPGDYLVRYDDGYLSWSSKAVFEAGYAEVTPATPGVGGPMFTQVDDVTVTVSAPAGKRAVVVRNSDDGRTFTQTVVGGQSHSFTVDDNDVLLINEGEPHSRVANSRE